MITSSSNARIKQVIQWQTKAKERRRDGVFVAEGLKMFEEAPAELIREVYISESFGGKLRQKDRQTGAGAAEQQFRQEALCTDGMREEALRQKLSRTGCETVKDDVFVKMSDTQTPQGILTVICQPSYEAEELLQRPNPLFIVLENLQDPGNLGTIMRTSEGAGVTAVLMTRQTVDLFNPKTIRSTMGSVFRVPFLYFEDIQTILEMLKKHHIRTFAAHLKGETYYDTLSFREPAAFLIGNEGNGLTDKAAQAADSYVKIPMEGQVESLNAAVAAALLMYEAHRQRSGR